MTYRELQEALKTLRAQGKTSIKLTAPRAELEKEYNRICPSVSGAVPVVDEAHVSMSSSDLTWEKIKEVCALYERTYPSVNKRSLERVEKYGSHTSINFLANYILANGFNPELEILESMSDRDILIAQDIATILSSLENSQSQQDAKPSIKTTKKANFVGYFENCSAQICKEVVRFRGELKPINILAINSPFNDKDEVSQWCKKREGAWHPLQKYWWVPLKGSFINDLKELSFFQGNFYCPNEKTRDIVKQCYNEAPMPQKMDSLIHKTFSVFPEQEKDYNSYDEFVSLKFDDQTEYDAQMQGYIYLKGEPVRVVMFPSKPRYEVDEIFYCQPRQYEDEEGQIWWVLPWVNPLDKFLWPSWGDEDVKGSDVLKPPNPEPPIMEIRALLKRNESGKEVCIGVRCILEPNLNTYEFNVALNWCKSKPGRTWNESKKTWDIFWSDRLANAISREIEKNTKTWEGKLKGNLKFSISDKVIDEILYMESQIGEDFQTMWSDGFYFTEGFDAFWGTTVDF